MANPTPIAAQPIESPADGTPVLTARYPAAVPPVSLVGRTLRGEYRLVSILGSGGFGDVYLAEQLNGNVVMRPAVVKVLRGERLTSEDALRRFHSEAQLLARMSHPNIVTLYSFGSLDDGSFFLAMEHGGEQTLEDALKIDGRLPPDRALAIAEQISEALTAAARRDVIHRDLKPSNVLLHREDGKELVKVVDFGIAKMVRDLSGDSESNTMLSLTGEAVFIGTPAYTSPEQAVAGPVDARSDLYALGVLLYEMLSGRKPFKAANPQAMLLAHHLEVPAPLPVTPGLPVALAAVAMKLLAKKPEDRFQSARQLKVELARIRSALAAPAYTNGKALGRQIALMAAAVAVTVGVSLSWRSPAVPVPRVAPPASEKPILGPQLVLEIDEPAGASVSPPRGALKGTGSIKVEVAGDWTLLFEYQPSATGWHVAVSSLPLAAVRVGGTLDGNRGEFDLASSGASVDVQLKAKDRVLRLHVRAAG